MVNELTNQLLESYGRVGGINHLDGKNLPSKRAIALITVDLLRLLFPGFFDEKTLHSSQLRSETSTILETVAARLQEEILRSLESFPPEKMTRKELLPLARQITVEFLGSLPRIREMLQTDVEAAFNGDPAALCKEEVIVAYPCVESIAVHRLAHELYLRKVALIPRIMSEWAHSRTGMDIHPGARIASHFFVDHCTGTVIGETSIIGTHVKMYQGVALIARSLSGGQQLRGTKRHPTIEDNVTIYAGATIMGGDTVVGMGSTIGANVFLSTSVPPRSLVLSEEVKVRVMSKPDREHRP
ncbi:MAG: serine O-acetyltransferase [Verrucomicrobia bacterium]|nr:serine O-acetyltransferase [Verrucomicrobiota bacterium]